jgi:site-specific DNA-methyltransferase (adenine-specific)
MKYLCNLTRTPTGGIVLDPFIGSGTTALAAIQTDRQYMGFEKEKEYFEIAQARIKDENMQLKLNFG